MERRLAGQEFIQDRAQPPDVGRCRQLLRVHLRALGRHVRRRARDFVVVDRQRVVHAARQPEVGDVRRTIRIDQHVAGLQVQVQDTQAMRIGHCLGRGAQQRRRRLRRVTLAALQQSRQAVPLHEAHAEELQTFETAGFVHRNDVRMLHARGVLLLALEALDEIARGPRAGGQQLDCDDAVERDMTGAVHRAHATLTDSFQQLVIPEVPLHRVSKVKVQVSRMRRRGRLVGRGFADAGQAAERNLGQPTQAQQHRHTCTGGIIDHRLTRHPPSFASVGREPMHHTRRFPGERT
ncbi:MAG TPA: hypothetical protein VJ823_08130 [Rhodanobacteraceae bacterium]|nr:hypothetical protein [Rhodanobacteraceae bacterium]